MEKEDNYPAAPVAPPSLGELDYTNPTNHHQHHQQMMMMMAASTAATNDVSTGGVADYMPSNPPPGPSSDHYGPSFSSFADVMQFADFGPNLALHNPSRAYQAEHGGVDPVYMLKFPVLNDHHHGDSRDDEPGDGGDGVIGYDEDHQESNVNEPVVQLEFLGGSGSLNQMMINTGSHSEPMVNRNNSSNNNNNNNKNGNGKRKRARSVKTTEEVESQRMTHIAVERNRRKQMNEHLRVLRSLMPSSYVQRGDQASIIGGAIEFVRELEQLLQCLESQKRRRLYGEGPGGGGVLPLPLPCNEPFGSNNDPSNDNPAMANKLVDLDGVMAGPPSGLREETAESKSSIADVEVKLMGLDAFIKILSRRRPGQLIKAISALQDLRFTILHTNITTIEQTVLYSFNIKVCSESRFSADDIASSVQQIFTFIHANTPM